MPGDKPDVATLAPLRLATVRCTHDSAASSEWIPHREAYLNTSQSTTALHRHDQHNHLISTCTPSGCSSISGCRRAPWVAPTSSIPRSQIPDTMTSQLEPSYSEIIDIYDTINTQAYCYFATIPWLLYEAIITLDSEVENFWKPKFTGASILYLMNRYTAVAYCVLLWASYLPEIGDKRFVIVLLLMREPETNKEPHLSAAMQRSMD
ncbi:hypothetical protein C8Q76DRAFT_93270 [Earliella scabrosa]|nr:hypothetical protein C8Q76DRAFT_93270 [Earliella scabrosa]